MRAGEVVLTAGTILKPAHLGVLASVGRTPVRVVRPQVAIVPTGDELVEPDQIPGPGQIRNSNAMMLRALAMEEGAEAESLPTAPDEADELRRILQNGLDSDVLMITGGVSAGQRDLVPAVLEELGVRCVFHKVRLKPGKPIWFGVGGPRAGRPGPLVFGLPGNPVSGLVGFLLFVRPAFAALAGTGIARGNTGRGPLEAGLSASRGSAHLSSSSGVGGSGNRLARIVAPRDRDPGLGRVGRLADRGRRRWFRRVSRG